MVRIKDIAAKANVSTATVSYVLNGSGNIGEDTRKKVLQVVEEMNYKPNHIAKSLKMKRTNTIGVLVEDITIFNATHIIDGINTYADENGLNIILTNMSLFKRIGRQFDHPDIKDIVPKAVKDLLEKQVDGLVYIGVHTRDISGLVPQIGKPIVYTYCYTKNDQEYSINYDDELAAHEATNYLISKGHQRIAVISGLIDSVPSHDRFQGFLRAIMEKQIPFNPAYVKTGDWEVESGYTLTKELMQLPERPTAILAMNDLMAVGVIQACEELELNIPKDLSVMGFDNREFSAFLKPKLTTMELPLHKMGHDSAEALMEIINRESNASLQAHEKPICLLIERESVADIN